MQPGLMVTGRSQAPDGFDRLQETSDVDIDTTPSYFGNDENKTLLGKLENWWTEARDAHAENRREQMIDADYVDMIQWRADEAEVLNLRSQAPLNTPLLKQVI